MFYVCSMTGGETIELYEAIKQMRTLSQRMPTATNIFDGERVSPTFARAEVCAVDLPDDPE